MSASDASSETVQHHAKRTDASTSAPPSGEVPEPTTSLTASDSIIERVLDLKYKWSGTIYELTSALLPECHISSSSLA